MKGNTRKKENGKKRDMRGMSKDEQERSRKTRIPTFFSPLWPGIVFVVEEVGISENLHLVQRVCTDSYFRSPISMPR